MRIRLLDPWVRGNNSITPENFLRDNEPNYEYGMFLSLDECADLYQANEFDSGNLNKSWNETRNYIKRSCDLLSIEYDLDDEDFDWTLDNEERYMILEKIGEPPLGSYNIYIISVIDSKDNIERVVYVGKTNSKKSRFANGHLAALKLHHPRYNNLQKKIYFGTLVFVTKDKNYLPLEFISNLKDANLLLDKVEKMLISHFKPELNTIGKKEDNSPLNTTIHIQNFTGETNFLNDVFVWPW